MTKEIREVVDGDPQLPTSMSTGPAVATASAAAAASSHESGAEGFMSKVDLANRFNVTVRTVDNWMKAGMVPYYKMNRMVLFTWSDVVTHLRANYRVCRKS